MSDPMLAAAPEPAMPKMTPGEIVAEMLKIREEKARLSEREKQLNEVWRALEAQLIALSDELGMKKMATTVATATVTEEVLPIVEDWDEVHAYMLENAALHLLQRRISSAAYRELQDAGIEIPGVRPYVQRKISLRKS